MPLCPCTNQEWLTLPHAVLTSEADWDPTFLDSPGDIENEIQHDAQLFMHQGSSDETFNEHGEFR